MKKIISLLVALILLASVMVMPTVSAAPAKKPSMNILVFSNEYLIDIAFMLQSLANWQGLDIQVGVLASEEGTLENHIYAFENDFNYCWDRKTGKSYLLDKEHEGGTLNNRDVHSISAKKLIKKKDWDVVVFGESIKYSGSYNIIGTNLPTFMENIKSVFSTDATVKYFWHDQWALEEKPATIDPADEFYIYDYDMKTMYDKVTATTSSVLRDIEFDGTIYTGEVFNVARASGKYTAATTNLLQEIEGNLSMHGQYLAALTWYMSITGCKINTDNLFVPTGVTTGITKEEAISLVDLATNVVTSKGVVLKDFDEVFSGEETGNQETTSSELVYNPGDFGGTDSSLELDPMLFVYIGAGVVVVAAVVVVVIVASKKKKSK